MHTVANIISPVIFHLPFGCHYVKYQFWILEIGQYPQSFHVLFAEHQSPYPYIQIVVLLPIGLSIPQRQSQPGTGHTEKQSQEKTGTNHSPLFKLILKYHRPKAQPPPFAHCYLRYE